MFFVEVIWDNKKDEIIGLGQFKEGDSLDKYSNVPMEIVSELLGHSSIKITQEYYGKIV